MLFDQIQLTDGQTSIKGLLRYVTMTQPGDLTVMTGVVRWYPPFAATLKTVQAYVGTPSTGAATNITIKKDNITLKTLSVPATQFVIANDSFAPEAPMLTTEYLTIDVTQVGSLVAGKDLTIRLVYTAT